ncbi:hypothetical protein H0H81_010355, partial [Sphagnurus paluster]
ETRDHLRAEKNRAVHAKNVQKSRAVNHSAAKLSELQREGSSCHFADAGIRGVELDWHEIEDLEEADE